MSGAHRYMLMSLVPQTAHADVRSRYREIADLAVFAEEVGFDAFGVGERHDAPYLSSSPAVLLAHLAAHTSTIRLFTAATTIALHDPVRAYEDYATVDQLSGGRLELIVGTGLGPTATRLFGIPAEEQADRTAAAYELLRDLWHQHGSASYDGPLRPALDGVALVPPPLQRRIPVWHAGLTSRESAARAAAWGEPLVSGNLFGTVDGVAAHVAVYREEWAAQGHDPAAARVGVGIAGVHVAPTSQEARRQFRPAYECQVQQYREVFGRLPYDDLDSYLATSTALVGSPAQVQEKAARLQERLGHQLTYHHADSPGLDPASWRRGKELFAEHVLQTPLVA